MSNIVGGPLSQIVQDQIERRQKIIGNNSEVLSELGERIIHNNNKSSWVRMASSVDITDTTKISKNLTGVTKGKNFSQQFALFGGINFSPSITRGGVTPDLDNIFTAKDYSYGLGGNEQGYQPIFGIDSVKVGHINRGAVRKFDIRLMAHNKTQLEIIETLYLRLGYYMLLEWGHTVYVNSTGNLVKSPEYFTPAYNTFYEEGKTDNDIIQGINSYQRESGGNYDGALVIVSNYSWNLEQDGSYSITISGISKGGLIDSLLLNYPEDTDTPSVEKYVIINPNTGEKNRILKGLGQSTTVPKGSTLDKYYSGKIADKLSEGAFETLKTLGAIQTPNEFQDQTKLEVSFENEQDNDNTITILDQRKSALNKKLFEYHKALKTASWININNKPRYKSVEGKDLITLKFDNPNKASDGYAYNYIKLGKLLDDIRTILFQDRNNVSIKIDNTRDENFMFTHPFQHSSDPGVCLVPFSFYEQEEGPEQKLLYDILGSDFRVEGDPNKKFQGKIMNIHVNMEFLAKTLQTSVDTDSGEISLYKFLDKVLSGIQSTLGDINRFNLTYIENSDSGKGEGQTGGGGLLIFDDTVIPGLPEGQSADNAISSTGEKQLKLFGVIPNVEGSFVRNINVESSISQKFATQITVGSTASGVNNSTTLLSRWNEGTENRLEAAKRKEQPTNSDNSVQENNKLLEIIKKKYKDHVEYIKNTYINFKAPAPSVITTAQSNLKYLLEYDLAVKTTNGELAGKGFIPINLTIELDGISGMLLFQRITPTEEILPYSYIYSFY